ncbi:hypothetical protein ABTD95_19225, partial [Acinetobacter baumannii]
GQHRDPDRRRGAGRPDERHGQRAQGAGGGRGGEKLAAVQGFLSSGRRPWLSPGPRPPGGKDW